MQKLLMLKAWSRPKQLVARKFNRGAKASANASHQGLLRSMLIV